MIIDQQLKTIYENAGYEIISPSIRLIPGVENEALTTLLIDNNAESWALITGYNAFGQKANSADNLLQQKQLIAAIEAFGYAWSPAMNTDPTGKWPDEPSCFIFEIAEREAIKLGRRFSQKGILAGRVGRPVQLHML